MPTVDINGETMKVKQFMYPDKSTRIDLVDEEEAPDSHVYISCAVEGFPLKPEYIYARYWGYVKEITEQLIEQGVLQSTGMLFPVSDYADALICKLGFEGGDE